MNFTEFFFISCNINAYVIITGDKLTLECCLLTYATQMLRWIDLPRYPENEDLLSLKKKSLKAVKKSTYYSIQFFHIIINIKCVTSSLTIGS